MHWNTLVMDDRRIWFYKGLSSNHKQILQPACTTLQNIFSSPSYLETVIISFLYPSFICSFALDQIDHICISWSLDWRHFFWSVTPLLSTTSAVILVFGPPRPGFKAAHVISQWDFQEMRRRGRELNLSHGESSWWGIFVLPLSYHELGIIAEVFITITPRLWPGDNHSP